MTRIRRWSDNDKNLGPFIYSKGQYNRYALILGSGDAGEYPGCFLRFQAFTHTFIVVLPQFVLKPYREKVDAVYWDKATIERMGRDWYWNYDEREFGFSYSRDDGNGIGGGGFLQIYYGRQSHSSRDEKRWSCFTPWNNWRHIRNSIYDLKGNHYATEANRPKKKAAQWGDEFVRWRSIQDGCPSRTFTFTDFDGELLTAKTRIEERQWEMGTGCFKWLSSFRKPIIRRSLDIEFSGETGKKKGSWKGGTIGHSIEMNQGELHNDAFIRYCEEHEMVFKGEGVWTR